MITDTTQDAQIRHSIRKEVMGMDLRMLQRIVYEGVNHPASIVSFVFGGG